MTWGGISRKDENFSFGKIKFDMQKDIQEKMSKTTRATRLDKS